jgi:hypothetical protein
MSTYYLTDDNNIQNTHAWINMCCLRSHFFVFLSSHRSQQLGPIGCVLDIHNSSQLLTAPLIFLDIKFVLPIVNLHTRVTLLDSQTTLQK